jgi:hypothetical protein
MCERDIDSIVVIFVASLSDLLTLSNALTVTAAIPVGIAVPHSHAFDIADANTHEVVVTVPVAIAVTQSVLNVFAVR